MDPRPGAARRRDPLGRRRLNRHFPESSVRLFDMPRVPILLISLSPLFVAPSHATTLVSVTDSSFPVDRAGYFLGGQFSNVVGISWTQSDNFSDVTIDADIAGLSAGFDSVTAYLMSAAGPGTTALSEVVAPAGVTIPTVAFAPGLYSGPPTVLFTDLVLGPGTYFLVLTAPFSSAPNDEIIWQLATTPNTVLDPSVTLGNTLLANTGTAGTNVAPFAPASTFESFEGTSLLFDVTTPEPGSLVLVSAALAGFVLRKSALFHKTKPNA
jgi:hypothetical protein